MMVKITTALEFIKEMQATVRERPFSNTIQAAKDNMVSEVWCPEIIKALEKQIPKKPKNIIEGCCCEPTTANCPVCGELLIDAINKYCGGCGQAIDWSEEE